MARRTKKESEKGEERRDGCIFIMHFAVYTT